MKPVPSKPRAPVISVMMTDEDVIARVGSMWGIKPYCYRGDRRNPNWKPSYRVSIRGYPAVLLMKRLRPWMGERRRAQIDRAVAAFEAAMATGRVGPKLTEETCRAIVARKKAGESAPRLAAEYGIRRETVYHVIKRMNRVEVS